MSYENALEAAGCNVIKFESFGSYQGDWYAYVELDGEKGVVSGCYGNCSHCDAFEGEFGWNDEKEEGYQERLKAFGESYLPLLPISHYVENLERRVNDGHDWGEEKEALEWLKGLEENGT